MKGGHLGSGEERKSGDGICGVRRAANGAFWVRMGDAKAAAHRGGGSTWPHATQRNAERIDAMCPLSSAG